MRVELNGGGHLTSDKLCFPHISQIGCFHKGLGTKLPCIPVQDKRSVLDAIGLFLRNCGVESGL